MNTMTQWMAAATADEQTELAKAAGTSRGHLYQISTGNRGVGPDLARRLEKAARPMRRRNRKLPVLLRTELCPACGACDYAQRCASCVGGK